MEDVDPNDIIQHDFRPYMTVRPETVREVVYVKRWQKLMCEFARAAVNAKVDDSGEKYAIDYLEFDYLDNGYVYRKSYVTIGDVLGYIPNDPHETRIASNVIYWLGTNSGLAFMEKAKGLYTKADSNVFSLSDIFTLQFARENNRDRCVNYGYIPLDSLCCVFERTGNMVRGITADSPETKLVREGTLRDREIVDRMIRWSASEVGQSFIEGCERNIAIKYKRQSDERQGIHGDVQNWLQSRPISSPSPRARRIIPKPKAL